MKRFFTRLLLLALSVIMLSSYTMTGNAGSTQQSETEVLEGHLITKDPTTLTIYCMDVKPFDDDYEIFRKAAEMTNISLHGTVAQSVSDGAMALNMMLASGDLADIIQLYGRTEWLKHGMSGALIPLNDLIDQYAPNYKRFLEENPDVKAYITMSDGNIYCIPVVGAGGVAKTWFIRQDWLDKLGLSVPNTVDDFYQVMKAFKASDLNDTGNFDIVPYFNRYVGTDFEESVSDLYVFWDAHKSWYIEDDVVKFGPYEPNFKTAISNIADWYKEGLLDVEIYTRNTARDVMLNGNRGGITHDYVGSTAEYNTRLADEIPGFDFAPFLPPGGVETSMNSRLNQFGWCISSKNTNPEITMQYFDFFFTEEGRRLMNFGIEGKHYEMVDGKPILTDYVLNNEKSALLMLQEAGAKLNLGYHTDVEYTNQTMNVVAQRGIEMYTTSAIFRPLFPNVERTVDDEKRYAQIKGNIDTLVNEMSQRWVLGSLDVESAWDKYISDLKAMNIDEMIEIQQRAYDDYLLRSK